MAYLGAAEELAEFASQAAKYKAAYDMAKGSARKVYGIASDVYDDAKWAYGKVAGVKRSHSGARRPVPLRPPRRLVPATRALVPYNPVPSRKNPLIHRRRNFAGPRAKFSRRVKGRFVGKFGRLKNKRRYDKFRSCGSTNKVEVSGNSTGTEVAEIGHSVCCPQLIMQSVGRAILRRGLEKLTGTVITDWSANAPHNADNYYYEISYRTSIEISTITNGGYVAFGGAVGISFTDMADVLMNAMLTLCTTGLDQILFESVNFRWGPAAAWNDQCTIPLRQSLVTFSVNSHLTIQNITESHTGGTDDHTNVLDVRANPVLGRCWMTKSNTFIPVGGSTEGFTSNVADERYGQIGDITGNMTYQKPPNFYSNAKRSGQVILQPGEIKHSNLKLFKRVYFNRFMRMFKRWTAVNTSVTAAGTDTYVGVGPSKLFHFEHMVKNSGDPSVSLGYEIDVFVKSYLSYRNKREALRIDGV
jgi:hypothetical protein